MTCVHDGRDLCVCLLIVVSYIIGTCLSALIACVGFVAIVALDLMRVLLFVVIPGLFENICVNCFVCKSVPQMTPQLS